jgi:hypothetical protein
MFLHDKNVLSDQLMTRLKNPSEKPPTRYQEILTRPMILLIAARINFQNIAQFFLRETAIERTISAIETAPGSGVPILFSA